MKGLCIIPEGRKTKECKDIGYPYEVTSIKHLKDFIAYSDKSDLGAVYLIHCTGISYSDDIIEYKTVSLNKMTNNDFRKWNLIVSEQILRMCLKYSVDTVYLMTCKMYTYKMLIKTLNSRGVRVITPLLGCKEIDIKKKLRV